MEIFETYCEDLRRVVEIYEAQEEYFSQPTGNRHRFEFRCSDTACRAEKNPLVVGVNYDKNAEESDKYQQPHFKSHTKHPHIDACIWMVGDAGRHEKDPSRNERDVRHPRPKATNVVDVFEPRHSDTLLGSAVADICPPAVISGDAVQEDGGQAGGRSGITTTSRLEKLIDCWSQLEPEDRRNHRIVAGVILIVFGDILGIPVLPPYYSLRLLPYVVPQVSTWKRRMLREKDLTDALA